MCSSEPGWLTTLGNDKTVPALAVFPSELPGCELQCGCFEASTDTRWRSFASFFHPQGAAYRRDSGSHESGALGPRTVDNASHSERITSRCGGKCTLRGNGRNGAGQEKSPVISAEISGRCCSVPSRVW